MLGEVAALLGALCFATSNVLIRGALDRVGPWWVNLVRTLSASVFLLPLTVLWRWSEVIAFHGLSGLSVFSASSSPSSLAIFYISRAFEMWEWQGPCPYQTPPFFRGFGRPFSGEPVTPLLVVRVVLVFVGVQIIAFEPQGTMKFPRKEKGLAVSLLAAIFWAVGSIFFRTALTQEDYVATAFLRMWTLSFLLSAGTFIRGGYGALHSAGREALLRIAVAGVISHGVRSILYMMSLSLIGAARSPP